eukprot:s702_g16.t1
MIVTFTEYPIYLSADSGYAAEQWYEWIKSTITPQDKDRKKDKEKKDKDKKEPEKQIEKDPEPDVAEVPEQRERSRSRESRDSTDMPKRPAGHQASPSPEQLADNGENGARIAPPQDEDEVHDGIACSGCHMTPIRGDRFKCQTCESFDLCEHCYERKGQIHPGGHRFFKKRFVPGEAKTAAPKVAPAPATPAEQALPPPQMPNMVQMPNTAQMPNVAQMPSMAQMPNMGQMPNMQQMQQMMPGARLRCPLIEIPVHVSTRHARAMGAPCGKDERPPYHPGLAAQPAPGFYYHGGPPLGPYDAVPGHVVPGHVVPGVSPPVSAPSRHPYTDSGPVTRSRQLRDTESQDPRDGADVEEEKAGVGVVPAPSRVGIATGCEEFVRYRLCWGRSDDPDAPSRGKVCDAEGRKIGKKAMPYETFPGMFSTHAVLASA